MELHSLLEFAHKLEGMAHKLEGSGGHGGAGADGGEVKKRILEKGAEMIEKSIMSGLAGRNVFGLAPLSAETIARKGNSDFLRETGALARSVEKSIGKDDARVGSNDDKITFLELGTSKMPPRPVFRSAGIQIEPAVHAMARAEVAKAIKE